MGPANLEWGGVSPHPQDRLPAVPALSSAPPGEPLRWELGFSGRVSRHPLALKAAWEGLNTLWCMFPLSALRSATPGPGLSVSLETPCRQPWPGHGSYSLSVASCCPGLRSPRSRSGQKLLQGFTYGARSACHLTTWGSPFPHFTGDGFEPERLRLQVGGATWVVLCFLLREA